MEVLSSGSPMRFLAVLAAIVVAAVGVLCCVIAFGGPRAPPPMASISDPYQDVDFSDLPAVRRFRARDGAELAYRAYPAGATPVGAAILIHGSSSRGRSMHALAAALARAGVAAYALDVRGHGDSGVRGRISYVGQLEDDLEDFVRAVTPPSPRSLVGFSAGGGFALRFAADPRQRLFDRYVLLSPFVHQDAPTYRPDSAGWVAVGLPRIIALGILNRLGITLLNDLPVSAFALDAHDRSLLTPTYSYALALNFRPHDDYRGDIRAARQPMSVLAGADDELHRADRFSAVFEEAANLVHVGIVPGVGHVGLTTTPEGIAATVSAVATGAAAYAKPSQ